MKKSPKTGIKQYVFDDKTRQNTINHSPIDNRTWDRPMPFHEVVLYDFKSQSVAKTRWMTLPSISKSPVSPDIIIRVRLVQPVAAEPFGCKDTINKRIMQVF